MLKKGRLFDGPPIKSSVFNALTDPPYMEGSIFSNKMSNLKL